MGEQSSAIRSTGTAFFLRKPPSTGKPVFDTQTIFNSVPPENARGEFCNGTPISRIRPKNEHFTPDKASQFPSRRPQGESRRGDVLGYLHLQGVETGKFFFLPQMSDEYDFDFTTVKIGIEIEQMHLKRQW